MFIEEVITLNAFISIKLASHSGLSFTSSFLLSVFFVMIAGVDVFGFWVEYTVSPIEGKA